MTIAHRTLGMSLVEVMVTLMLVACAAASMVRVCMHVRATASQVATQQMAWRLASELAEWLRLRGDRPLGELPEDPASVIDAYANLSDCYSTACLPADAARFFLHDWYRRLRTRVPDVRLVLCHGLPGKTPTASQSDSPCAGRSRSDEVVWFRLWKPPTITGTEVFKAIELSIRRAP